MARWCRVWLFSATNPDELQLSGWSCQRCGDLTAGCLDHRHNVSDKGVRVGRESETCESQMYCAMFGA